MRKPSPAMVVAVLALLVALGGTAAGAFGPFNGNQIIKKHSLSGNRLKKHTISGAQINFGKLGSVPNADRLGGSPASAYEPSAHFIRSGLVKAPPGQTVPLVKFGPFALSLTCIAGSGQNIDARILATSTVAGSDGYGLAMTNAGTQYTVLSVGPPSTGTTTFMENDDNAADFMTPIGNTYIADLTVGQNFPGHPGLCFANALVSPS